MKMLNIDDFTLFEANFLQYPLGLVNNYETEKSYKYSYVNQNSLHLSWEVRCFRASTLPSPSAVDIDRAISKLIYNTFRLQKKYSPPICTTYYSLLSLTNKKQSGSNIYHIRKWLKMLADVEIHSEYVFKQKNDSLPRKVLSFKKYDAIIQNGDKFPKNLPKTFRDKLSESERKTGISKHVYIFPSGVYLRSLRNHYVKPINFNFVMSLPSAVCKRIYEMLSFGFSAFMRNDHSGQKCIYYNYLDFCSRIPVTVYKYPYDAERKLRKYFRILFRNKYVSSVVYNFVGPQDRWFLVIYPGKNALDELDFCDDRALRFNLSRKITGNNGKITGYIEYIGPGRKVEISGDFTGKQRILMSGGIRQCLERQLLRGERYWVFEYSVIPGKYRYNFIVDSVSGPDKLLTIPEK